ncbi:transcriptional regulator [Paraburkholderia hospita]|nr:transcriptional regulator [Paraburkholderia hospita]
MNGIVKVFMPRAAYEDSLMHITFTDDAPVFDGSSLTVRFNACVDGEPVACAISAEALEDHFGADSPLEDTLIVAYERGRARIRSVCAEALDQNAGGSVILHSGLFRVEGMESDRRLKT